MIKCAICKIEYNPSEKGTLKIKRKVGICNSCVKQLIDGLFSQGLFNEWFDSFLQSRLEKYIPKYNEYLKRYNKQKCPDCVGTGFINGKTCKRCYGVGVIDADVLVGTCYPVKTERIFSE